MAACKWLTIEIEIVGNVMDKGLYQIFPGFRPWLRYAICKH